MPLPKSSEKYLNLALKKLQPKGTIHLYPVAIHPKRSWHGGEAPSALPRKKSLVFEDW